MIISYLAMRDSELRPIAAGRSARRPWAAVVENLAEGARYVRQTPLVLLAVTIVGLVATFGMNFQVLVPPLADTILNVGASGFGFLMAASGVGSTIASLWVAFSAGRTRAVIVWGAIALGLGSIVLAMSTSFPISLLAMAIAGAGGIGMAVTANTTIQLSVPGPASRPGDERLHDGLRGLGAGRRAADGRDRLGLGRAAGAGDRRGPSLAVGVGGWFWLRRIRVAGLPARPPRAGAPRWRRHRRDRSGRPLGGHDQRGAAAVAVQPAATSSSYRLARRSRSGR